MSSSIVLHRWILVERETSKNKTKPSPQTADSLADSVKCERAFVLHGKDVTRGEKMEKTILLAVAERKADQLPKREYKKQSTNSLSVRSFLIDHP